MAYPKLYSLHSSSTHIQSHYVFFFLILLQCITSSIEASTAATTTATAFRPSSSRSLRRLSYDFYKKTCPNVERIIHNVVSQKLLEAPTTAAGALRLFFHDCFVEHYSCIIFSPGDGFDAFFRAKRALELQCPGVVSCADVMAIATRDLVNLLRVGGPRWEVLKGRRDGLISMASRVDGNLPQANQTISQLISLFKSKGLTILDMVALSGAHTIGFSHCKEFTNRIYTYNKTFDVDPTMNKDYAQSLRTPCPRNKKDLDPTVVAFNDVSTPTTFDNAYYQNLQKGLGLLETDQMLFTDILTRGLVDSLANDQQIFFSYFVAAMIKLGNVGVKTGSDGEIRHDSGFFNT